jgi:hypothetical protein
MAENRRLQIARLEKLPNLLHKRTKIRILISETAAHRPLKFGSLASRNENFAFCWIFPIQFY